MESPTGSIKGPRWERFVFEAKDFGLEVLQALLLGRGLPTRKRNGYELFVGGVTAIAYCEEYGEIRVHWVLGQRRCEAM